MIRSIPPIEMLPSAVHEGEPSADGLNCFSAGERLKD
jgi:hypothetical protein